MAKRRSNGEGSMRYREDKKIWEASYTDPSGDRRYITAKKESDVRTKLTAAIYGMDTGTYVPPDKMTVDEWIEKWLWTYKKRSVADTTFDDYRRMWKLYISPHIGSKKLQRLRGDDVQGLVNAMVDKKLGSATIKLSYVILNSALKKASTPSLGLLKINPAYGAELPKSEKKDVVVLSAEERVKFVQEAHRSVYGDLYLLMLNTGMRPGETLGLKWSEVDLEQGIIRIRATMQTTAKYDEKHNVIGTIREPKLRAKTKSSRRDIPIMPDTRTILNRIVTRQKEWSMKLGKGRDDLPEMLCSGPQGTVPTYGAFATSLKRMLKKVDLPEISPHKLRHTFATRGLENGFNPKIMQDILGHSTIAMTLDTYSHVLPDVKRKEMEKLIGMV